MQKKGGPLSMNIQSTGLSSRRINDPKSPPKRPEVNFEMQQELQSSTNNDRSLSQKTHESNSSSNSHSEQLKTQPQTQSISPLLSQKTNGTNSSLSHHSEQESLKTQPPTQSSASFSQSPSLLSPHKSSQFSSKQSNALASSGSVEASTSSPSKSHQSSSQQTLSQGSSSQGSLSNPISAKLSTHPTKPTTPSTSQTLVVLNSSEGNGETKSQVQNSSVSEQQHEDPEENHQLPNANEIATSSTNANFKAATVGNPSEDNGKTSYPFQRTSLKEVSKYQEQVESHQVSNENRTTSTSSANHEATTATVAVAAAVTTTTMNTSSSSKQKMDNMERFSFTEQSLPSNYDMFCTISADRFTLNWTLHQGTRDNCHACSYWSTPIISQREIVNVGRTDEIQQRHFTRSYFSKSICDYLLGEENEEESMNFNHYDRSPFLVYLIQNKKSTIRSNQHHQEEQVQRLKQFWSWTAIPHKIVVVNAQSFSKSLRISEVICMGHLGIVPVLSLRAVTEIYKLRKNTLILCDDPSSDGMEYIATAKGGLSNWNQCSFHLMNGTHYSVGDGSKCNLAYGSIPSNDFECILKSLVLNWINRSSNDDSIATAQDHTIIVMGGRSIIVRNLLLHWDGIYQEEETSRYDLIVRNVPLSHFGISYFLMAEHDFHELQREKGQTTSSSSRSTRNDNEEKSFQQEDQNPQSELEERVQDNQPQKLQARTNSTAIDIKNGIDDYSSKNDTTTSTRNGNNNDRLPSDHIPVNSTTRGDLGSKSTNVIGDNITTTTDRGNGIGETIFHTYSQGDSSEDLSQGSGTRADNAYEPFTGIDDMLCDGSSGSSTCEDINNDTLLSNGNQVNTTYESEDSQQVKEEDIHSSTNGTPSSNQRAIRNIDEGEIDSSIVKLITNRKEASNGTEDVDQMEKDSMNFDQGNSLPVNQRNRSLTDDEFSFHDEVNTSSKAVPIHEDTDDGDDKVVITIYKNGDVPHVEKDRAEKSQTRTTVTDHATKDDESYLLCEANDRERKAATSDTKETNIENENEDFHQENSPSSNESRRSLSDDDDEFSFKALDTNRKLSSMNRDGNKDKPQISQDGRRSLSDDDDELSFKALDGNLKLSSMNRDGNKPQYGRRGRKRERTRFYHDEQSLSIDSSINESEKTSAALQESDNRSKKSTDSDIEEPNSRKRTRAARQTRPSSPIQMYVGERIAKKFDETYYNGTITAHMEENSSDEELWHVRYDDGDEEDLDKFEIQMGMSDYKNLLSWE